MEIALLCLCVWYAVTHSFQLEIIGAWGKASREILFTHVRKHHILKTPPINFVSLGDGLMIKVLRSKEKNKHKTRKEGVSKSWKSKLATVSVSEIRGPGISVHSQEPAGRRAAGGDVRSASVPRHWAQERPDKQFYGLLWALASILSRFHKSLQLSLWATQTSYNQNLNQRQHVTFILTLELLLFSLSSAQPPKLSGTLRTIQIKTNKYNQLFVGH